jgi:hypothetical protein
MNQNPDFQSFSIPDLARCCAQETERYFRKQSHDSRYCFELFRRAVRDRDQFAWEMIYTQYNSLVAGWVIQNQRFEAAGEDVEYFVNGAFAKMANILTPSKFEGFSDLSFVLQYLKMCVHSVIVDFDRSAHQEHWDSLDQIEEKESDEPRVENQEADRAFRKAFWDWINARLHDEKEHAVIYGSFVLELKPQELLVHYQKVFVDLDEIYRVKQNVLARLRRDDEFQKLVGQYD